MSAFPATASPPIDAASRLMLAVQAGDAVAFAQLVQQLQGPGLRLATRTLNDAVGAEDVLQIALTRMWTMADRFDATRGPVEAWFRRILINLCLDRRRSLRLVAPLEEAESVADAAPNPEAAAIASDRRGRLHGAMARLAPRQRAALAMFHGEGLTMIEIAAALETTPKAVEGLLGRARIELKRLLTDAD